MQNFGTYDNPFWDFSNGVRGGRRLVTKNSGLPKLLCWSHALCSDQDDFLFCWVFNYLCNSGYMHQVAEAICSFAEPICTNWRGIMKVIISQLYLGLCLSLANIQHGFGPKFSKMTMEFFDTKVK